MGHQHSCLYGGTARCPRNVAGKPKSKKCTACGGQWFVQQGMFGVFTWRGDGRYAQQEAHATYASSLRAEKHAATDPLENLVVRFIAA